MTLYKKINQYLVAMGTAVLLAFSPESRATPVSPNSLMQKVDRQECLETNNLEYLITMVSPTDYEANIKPRLGKNPEKFLIDTLLKQGYNPIKGYFFVPDGRQNPRLEFTIYTYPARMIGAFPQDDVIVGADYFSVKVYDKENNLVYAPTRVLAIKPGAVLKNLIPPSCQQLRQAKLLKRQEALPGRKSTLKSERKKQ